MWYIFNPSHHINLIGMSEMIIKTNSPYLINNAALAVNLDINKIAALYLYNINSNKLSYADAKSGYVNLMKFNREIDDKILKLIKTKFIKEYANWNEGDDTLLNKILID